MRAARGYAPGAMTRPPSAVLVAFVVLVLSGCATGDPYANYLDRDLPPPADGRTCSRVLASTTLPATI